MLTILIAAFIPICIGNVAGNMVVAMDLQRRYIWFAALGLVLNVPLNMVLIPEYGIEAAAWVTLATEVDRRLAEHGDGPAQDRDAALAAAASRWPWLRRRLAALAVWGLRQAGAGAIVLVAGDDRALPAAADRDCERST